MRKLLVALILFTVAALFSPLSAAESEVAFSRIGVRVSLEKTPGIEYKATKIESSKTHSRNNQWVVIAVDYYPGVVRAGKGDKVKNARGVKGGWIDDVTCEVNVEMPMDGTEKKNSGVLTGQCKLWCVALDGKIHTALMLVPPKILDRYLPMRGGSEYVAKTSDFRVQAIFRDASGKVLGEGYCNINVSEDKASEYFRNLMSGVVIKNAVFPRDKTPWAWHHWDRYDLLKSE